MFSEKAMFRYPFLFAVAVFTLCSAGCRMCGTDYDNSVPAYVARDEDYRGNDPQYRAGSVFKTKDNFINAGNYGTVTSMNGGLSQPKHLPNVPKPVTSPIGVPGMPPSAEDNGELRGIEDILRRNDTVPITPPTQPKIPAPDTFESTPIESVPFSPNDAVPPVPHTGEPKITIEEIQKLDPQAKDIRILKVEDSGVVPSLTPRR